MAHHEFLPLCDVLFNIISLASYFCDVVFDVVMGYALFERGRHVWFAVSLTFVATSLVISQVISLKWYICACESRRKVKEKSKNEDAATVPTSNNRERCFQWLVGLLHVIQCGVLWRYFKLFIPVDLRYVKHEVRDLCMLRLFHAFCEAAPMLLVQLYLLWQETSPKNFSDLNIVSTVLSLFSVCWALASFSKNVRLQNVHRLVLTWLGVIFQFMWRLGTVSSRVTALTVYATLYGHWVFLVIGLHWISMFLWLISPKNVFHGERISRRRKAAFSALIAFVYVFSYINLQEVNPRQKMATFYVVMFLENALLVTAWLVGVWSEAPWYRNTVPIVVFVSFATGICFMILYYRYFHVRRLRYEAGGRPNTYNNNCDSTQRLANVNNVNCGEVVAHGKDEQTAVAKEVHCSAKAVNNCQQRCTNGYLPYQHGGIPGVFNCRFNNPVTSTAATKRKKKKPTSFVPPPAVTALPSVGVPSLSIQQQQNCLQEPYSSNMSLQLQNSVPFWRRPLPNNQHNHQGGSSENEASSVGSRVNIQQKLQEKKQKQLAELRIIEEEIKQGKIQRPGSGAPSGVGDDFGSLPRQPIPRAKRHNQGGWPPPTPPSSRALPPPYSYHLLPPPRAKHRSKTPEILLAPHYLEGNSIYCSWEHERGPVYRLSDDDHMDRECSSDHGSSYSEAAARGAKDAGCDSGSAGAQQAMLMYKSYRIPSDMDSQISLPRSYTLPREFKYYRRPKSRKAVRSEHFVASTNSSDGDVDSGDETPHHNHEPPQHHSRPVRMRPYRGYVRRDLHETKL
ncbi:uncharacterized protein LOC126279092 isoform X2 [Schistocerca gregaria]|uniref:uncharacterized protein LOC126279092 isoform X2 n=1 Tax=Schistocerca gregaria TaxID=7010 RepID=UPI00211E0DD8|nr:uncharacterized protein LOC126279092 isoform X2 [Schistocerca gregaria]